MPLPSPLQTPDPDRILQTDARIALVSFSADGKTLVGLGYDRKVRIWDSASGAVIRTIALDSDYIFGVAIAPAANFLAAGNPDKSVNLLSLTTGSAVLHLTGHTQMPYGYAYRFSPDGKLLATSAPGQVRLWELPSGKLRFQTAEGPGVISSFAFSPDGRMLVGANEDTNVRVWDAQSGRLLHILEELPLMTYALTFSKNGANLISAGVDQRIYLWSTESWKRVREFEDSQPEPVMSMDLSPDGRILATGGLDAASVDNPAHLVLWDMSSGKALKTFRLVHSVASVAFSPDGRTIAVANLENDVKLWQVSKLLGR
jgi:uncharacterized protein with WD repeat